MGCCNAREIEIINMNEIITIAAPSTYGITDKLKLFELSSPFQRIDI